MTPLAALLIDWALTAFWPIVGKAGVEMFTGVLFAHAGLLLAFLMLLPWLCRKGRLRRIFSPGVAWPLFLVGFFASGLPNFTMMTALGYTTPANAAIAAQVEVLYSAFLCSWLLKERVSLSQAVASALVVAGTGLIVAHDAGSIRWKGDLLILATPWMYQVSHIFAKRLPKDIDEIEISGGRLFFGGLSLVPFSAWALLAGARWSWSGRGWALLLTQGLFMNVLNTVLWYVAIRRMDLAKATAIMLSYPALTVVVSWGMGAEPFRAAQLAGLALTLGGAYWLSMLVLAMAPEAGDTPLMPVEG